MRISFLGMTKLRLAPVILAAILSTTIPAIEAQTTAASKPASVEEKSPTNLAREIHHQLLVLPYYSVFDNINFTLRGRTVTLTGQVVRPTLKANAEAAVKSIEGVTAVSNQIEILPASPDDDDLRRAVYRAIYEDPALAAYGALAIPPIHIIVKNAVVTLEGSVESVSDKSLAAARAGKVANVQSVKNNLVVRSKGSAGE
jgi:hyperosmotically inducible periplasmic protein